MEEREYLVPNYYGSFACKMGKCRTACCDGWPVSFSLNDYFKLMGQECGDDLRRRLDTGIKISLSPTPERYATIMPRYDGSCPMRLGDGRCAIHAELGENALSHVCRLYPRGIRFAPGYECALANSCEGVLELMFAMDEPIVFEKQRLSILPPPMYERKVEFSTMGKEQEIRLWLIKQLQNRKYPMAERLMRMGMAMQQLETVLNDGDSAKLNKLLSEGCCEESPAFEVGKEHLLYGLETMEKLVDFLDARSDSIRIYGVEALSYFGKSDGVFCRYETAKKSFENRFSKWEIWTEHMLVNHMFFEQFPFQDRPVSLWNEFVAICAVYGILRFISIGWMSSKKGFADYVDMCAAAFRLVDHTSFDSYAANALFGFGCTEPQKVFDIVAL